MLLWRDADPVVRDRELDKARADEPCFAAYRTARSEFHGIRYQVDQHLHDLAAIGPDSGQARLHIRLEVEVLTAVQRRSEEHKSELQSLMRISYAVFCLKKKKQKK